MLDNMSQWPQHVLVAADAAGYDTGEPSGISAIRRFFKRWGGWDAESLKRAIEKGKEADRHFALHLLISSATPEAREEAATYLERDDSMARWQVAIYLGVLRDKRVTPALARMLTEALPPAANYLNERHSPIQGHLEGLRISAAYLLGALGEPNCIPSLRQALLDALQIEYSLPQPTTNADSQDWRISTAANWLRSFEDAIVYSTGQLGGFGLLSGISYGDERGCIWPIHLIMGSLHRRFPVQQITRFSDYPPLLTEIGSIMTAIFGFSHSDIQRCLIQYETLYLSQVATLYEAEIEEHNRHVT